MADVGASSVRRRLRELRGLAKGARERRRLAQVPPSAGQTEALSIEAVLPGEWRLRVAPGADGLMTQRSQVRILPPPGIADRISSNR